MMRVQFLLISFLHACYAFVIPLFPPSSSRIAILLDAKNTNKNKKRVGGARGGGRKSGKRRRNAAGGTVEEEYDDTNSGKDMKPKSIPAPTKFRKQIINFKNPSSVEHDFLNICTMEIDDVEWWEHENNSNPYGARLWPSALAISELLVKISSSHNTTSLNGYDVLELGCGVGLVSIVAAENGARVVASDISPTVLKLCKMGYLETQKIKMRKKKKESNSTKNVNGNDDNKNTVQPGTLNTFNFDIFSQKPIPLSSSSSAQKIVTATAMMYEKSLATGLARRAMEACIRHDAWVIIGDDDTGEREGGRQLFLSEMDKLEKERGVEFERTWTNSKVKNDSLQWREKQVKILHINPNPNLPSDVVL